MNMNMNMNIWFLFSCFLPKVPATPTENKTHHDAENKTTVNTDITINIPIQCYNG